MKKITTGLLALVILVLAFSANAQAVNQENENPTAVVGTFDSRAIAVAYVRSNHFDNRMKQLRASLDRAIESGDQESIALLKAEGPKLQAKIHKQGFGTASVEGILDYVRPKLPDFAKANGVELIVSKWVVTYTDPDAEFVDVTDELAALFNPDEATLKVIEELLTTEPIPDEELEELEDH